MSKYSPLKWYLSALPSDKEETTISFDQVVRIIGDKLPNSARRYPEWWSNEESGSHVQAHAWMNAIWVVETVNLNDEWVRFHRER
jgi:hypothetical protein